MDKATKKRIKRYSTWALLAALVALLAAMPLLAKREAEADGPVASVLSATATLGDLSTALHGGGTLSAATEEVNLPSGVKIEEFLVKNGAMVTEGTPLAKVDRVSVMTTILQVDETLEYLREELEDARNEKVPGSITAAGGGRVKMVFAQAGESVMDVMLRDGALAVLSLDGLMAASFQTDSPAASGETLPAVLEDGTAVTCRVESNLSGQVVVTLEDKGYAPGQLITVDGLGTGELYIHNAWKATAYSGTVAHVSIRPEQTVSSGTTLLTLEDRDFDGELRRRAAQHREYEELLQRLLVLYESGTIDAPCDGMVSGVEENSPHLLSAQEEDWEAAPLVNGERGTVQLMLLGAVPQTACTGLAGCPGSPHDPDCPEACLVSTTPGVCTANHHKDGCIEQCQPAPGMKGCSASVHKAGCITLCTQAAEEGKCPNPKAGCHYSNCIKSCTEGTIHTPCAGTRHHTKDCIQSCGKAQTADGCQATGNSLRHWEECIRSCIHSGAEGECKDAAFPHYLDCIQSCTGEDACPASRHKAICPLKNMTFTGRLAKVVSVGTQELVVYWDSNPIPYSVSQNADGSWSVFGFTGKEFLTPGKVENPGGYQEGDVILFVTGIYEDGREPPLERIVKYSSGSSSGGAGGRPNSSGGKMDLSGLMGGISGFGSYGGTTQAPQENLHDLQGSTLMTVTPQDTMTLEIALDEQDIAQVTTGMEATVTVEALKGQGFPAKVTKVGTHGSNSGGSSKFTVELTLDTQADMLSGMSAAARLPLERRRGILTVPAAALFEDRGKTFVYTALDKDSEEPTAPAEVTTGISDGEQVQILAGLTEGTTVYYLYYDKLELDTSAQAERFTLN